MQYLITTAEGLNGSVPGAYPVPPFKFHLRSESVDWRRLSAVDVDRVMRELDVATLQDNIIHVTFCSLDQEVCHRCRQPLDRAMLNLVRLAQLTIEYLLHCQNFLSTTITQLETRLQASLSQQEKDRQELERQAQEFKGVKEESRQRRKMIHTLQQLLLQTGGHSYQLSECHLCDKAFMNVTFLQSHMQRKHLNMAEGAKQKKPEWLLEEDMLEELRDKLKQTQEELEAQREAEKRRQLQEAEASHQKEIETKKKFDEWKEKERASLYEEIDKFKKSLWDEFKSVTNHNSMLEEKLQKLQSQSQSMMESNLKFQLDKSGQHFEQSKEIQALKEKVDIQEKLRQTQELEALREKTDIQKTEWKRKMKELQKEHAAQKREKLQMMQSQSQSMMESNLKLLLDESQVNVKQNQEIQALKEKMDIQKTEWKRKMKELQKEHAAQKRELQEQMEKLPAYMYEIQQKAAAESQEQINALKAQLQKYANRIASQKQVIRTMSLRKEEGTCKGLKAVEPEDSSSEEIVTSALREKVKKQGSKQKGVSDLKNSRGDQQKVLASLRPKPTLLKFRSMVEKTLEKKLESMGIPKNKKGISIKTLQYLEPLLRYQRLQKTQECSEFLSLRVKFDKEVTSRAKKIQKKERTLRFQLDTKAPVQRQRGPKVIKEAQPKPKAKTLPVALPSSVAEVPMETRQSLKGHGPGLARVPAPIPHQRAHGHFDSPASLRRGLSKSPFSLEEDSEQQTLLQPKQGPFRKRPQSRADWECSDIENLEESPQPPDKSSVQRQRGPKVIKEAQPKPKAKTLPVALPSSVAEVPMETRQSLKGHGPGLARVPAPIPHQRAHGHFDSPASLRRGLSTSPFSLEEDSEQQTLLQPKQGPFRKRPQSRADWECSDIETLEESPQPPDKSSGGLASSVQRQRGPKVIKEAQAKPKPRTLPVALPSSVAEVPMETRQSLKGHGPGLARVPAPIPHQRAHGHFDSPASLRRGLSKSPFSLEEDAEQQTFLQPIQDPFRPQSRADWECSDIVTLEKSPQPPDKSSVQRQRCPKVIKEAQAKPKPRTLPVALPSSVAEVPMETRQSHKGHGPGLAQVPAPIPHQRAHGHFDSPASLRRGLSKSPFSLEEDAEQQTFHQPIQDPFRPQSLADLEFSDIETLEEIPQPPDKSSVQRQRGPKVIKEAQAKPKPRTLPVALPSSVAEVPMETRQSLKGHGPGLARVPAPIPHQRAHGHFDSPASLRRGLSKSPFSLEEDAEQQTLLQPLQDPFRPQSWADWECSDIETLEESPQPPDKSSGGLASSVQRQRGPKVIKEAQAKPKPRTLPVALPSSVAEVPMETRQSLKGHGPGLARVPAPIPHQRAHGHFDSPASLRRGLSKSPFSLEEDAEQQTFLQPLQDPFRPQSRADWECSDIVTLEKSPQPPDKSSGGLASSVQRQRCPKVIKEAQAKPKPRTLPVALPSSVAEVPMETRQSHKGHGPGLAQVPAPIPHQRAHGHFDSPASLRRGLSKSPFSLEEDAEQQTFHQPIQDPFRPQSLADLEFSDIETLEEIPQPPDKSSETMVQSLVKNFEEELDVPVQKPHGGIKLFLPSKGGSRRAAVPGSEPQLSDDESDLSSLIEFFKTQGQKLEMKPLEMFNASPWIPM